MARTLIVFKPDCVGRGLVGECLARFEHRGLTPLTLRVVAGGANRVLVERHYDEHAGRPYFGDLVAMMCGGPFVVCVLHPNNNVPGASGYRDRGADQDDSVVALAREILGPYQSPLPGTIRGDFQSGRGPTAMYNLVHASDSEESATREIGIWFP